MEVQNGSAFQTQSSECSQLDGAANNSTTFGQNAIINNLVPGIQTAENWIAPMDFRSSAVSGTHCTLGLYQPLMYVYM